jgi:3',5'-cyclic AMP phosphodiesterase CpdA
MPRSCLAAVAALAVLAFAPAASAAPFTTVDRTMQDCDGDNLLEPAAGERHVPVDSSQEEPGCRPESGTPVRLPQNASLLHFLHLSDFQIVDEESPARVELLDTTQRAPGLNPFSAAYRPQESLTTQVTEAMVRQARNSVSPVTGKTLDFTILTGDNADSQQYNETRWFIDILDGTTGPENPDPEMSPTTGNDRKIVPDSGVHERVTPATCGAIPFATYRDNGSIYDGVRGGGRPGQDPGYYEPDGEGDGDGYTPDRVRNQAEVPGPHADVTVRDFPGLFEAAQQPFEAVGLGMPWYTAFGNHDALVQGNSPEAFVGPFDGQPETVNPVFDGIARGCLKPSKLQPGTSPEEYIADPLGSLAASEPVVVPPDDRRCFVAKDEPNTAASPCATGGWIQQHDRTTGAPVGHGFQPFTLGAQTGEGRPPSAIENHDGYYAFTPKPGFRFLVLDTVTDECGALVCSEGSVDDAQYQWADRELQAADDRGQRVLVFSHHTLRTIRFPSTDPSEQPVHYGERFDRMSTPPRPVRPTEPPNTTLEDLWCRHPSVVGHVVGHDHENYVLKHRCEDPGQGPNQFYEISTAAHIDWPQQSRLIEFVNMAGQLSLVLTIVDHNGEPKPDGTGQEPVKLASIARELAYNDYQGYRTARGDRTDRNVIVPLARPAEAGGMLPLASTAAVGANRTFAFPFAALPGTAVTLDVLAPVSGNAARAAAARRVRIGRARLTVPESGRARAVVRLSRRGARMVRQRRRLPVVARATLQRPGAAAVTRRAKVTLVRRR